MELAPGTVLYSNKTLSFLQHLILPSPQWMFIKSCCLASKPGHGLPLLPLVRWRPPHQRFFLASWGGTQLLQPRAPGQREGRRRCREEPQAACSRPAITLGSAWLRCHRAPGAVTAHRGQRSWKACGHSGVILSPNSEPNPSCSRWGVAAKVCGNGEPKCARPYPLCFSASPRRLWAGPGGREGKEWQDKALRTDSLPIQKNTILWMTVTCNIQCYWLCWKMSAGTTLTEAKLDNLFEG